MGFKTIGWFGNSGCYGEIPPSLESPNKSFDMIKLKSGTQLSFPLEIATKIFWLAKTINLNASITVPNTPNPPFTYTVNETFPWGIYYDEIFSLNLRTSVTTAKEMLCLIKDSALPFPSHTVFRKRQIVSGGTTSNLSVIQPKALVSTIDADPEDKTLYAPFLFAVSARGQAITCSSTGDQVAYGSATIITPWGNVSVPIFGSPSVISASMTITITEEDPAIRFV
jgi:hypothetical protein